MLGKKGQKSGAQAATLIALITMILLAYILFLPPEDRETLLEDETGTGTSVSGSSAKNITLVNATSLRLEFIGEDKYEHTIPNIYLSEKTESNVIETATPFYVRNGWFDKKTSNMSFYINDLENTDNVAVTFEAPKAKGNLLISVNGVQIFDYEAVQLNVGPVTIRKELLKEGENILDFAAAGVGMKFWSTNEYSIEDLQITADLKDVSGRESMNVFTIANEEFYNIESARVQFYPVCQQASVGKLSVMLNNREVFAAIPDCGMQNRQDVFSTDLNSGKNTISFRTEKGSYRVELIKIITELKDIKTFLAYFEVNTSVYNDIKAGKKDAILEIRFVDDRETKKAQININGHLTQLDQTGAYYSRKVGSWMEQGARNYFEITPESLLKIVEMKITVVKK